MALSVRPDLIDVNVHPTKKQVIIERQDDLCELLTELLDFHFTQMAGSRTYSVKPITSMIQTDLKQFASEQQESAG
jgi:DNA mismatch repair ATPase MutL